MKIQSFYYRQCPQQPKFRQVRTPADRKNIARHASDLSLEELMNAAGRLMKLPEGKLAVVFPLAFSSHMFSLAERNHLFISHQLLIRDNPKAEIIRSVLVFSNHHSSILKEETLTIKKEDGNYSGEFVELMRPFYLYL